MRTILAHRQLVHSSGGGEGGGSCVGGGGGGAGGCGVGVGDKLYIFENH